MSDEFPISSTIRLPATLIEQMDEVINYPKESRSSFIRAAIVEAVKKRIKRKEVKDANQNTTPQA